MGYPDRTGVCMVGWQIYLGVCFLCGALLQVPLAHAGGDEYSFGVLSQRSAVLTARYWNPILEYASRKSGVTLSLQLARGGAESSEAAVRGDYDFIYSNHIFQPRMAAANYQVILRGRDEAITGQIVVLASSPVRELAELAGREVGFPSRSAFVGYALPFDQLLRQRIEVMPVFGGNQEGIMAQLKAGSVDAAGVNASIMKAYAERERIAYRVLWESPPYFNLPVAAHPRVPKAVVEAVRAALDGMEEDPAGAAILKAAAALVGESPPFGFRTATQADYRNYVEFYRNTLIRDFR